MNRIYTWALISWLTAAGCQFQKKNTADLSLEDYSNDADVNLFRAIPEKAEEAPTATNVITPNTQTPINNTKQSFAESILFQPTKFPKGFQALSRNGQPVEFKSEDGTKLDGLFFPSKQPKHIILFCHGNSGNLGFRAPRMSALQKRHAVSIFIFDYRGYGRSQGKPTISGVLADGRAAVRKAAELADVSPSEVIIMGRSLGGAVAVQLAQQFKSKALIIESSFTSFTDIAKHHARLFSWLTRKNDLDSESVIQDYHGKVLISHGTQDWIVPFEQGQRLFAAANQPKQFYRIEKGGHNDRMPDRYEQILETFLEDL
ncbi:MAG: alpha/beta hydrolase [Planctomycetota bacterium]|nr:alpha/beta hydrolase [Planctomycetota bacterium]